MDLELIKEDMIAPCGMDCAVCVGHLRIKNKCPGCKNGPTIPHCQKCRIKLCLDKKGEYCSDCAKFPCTRLKSLDKRYREKYSMSEIANLEFIRDKGMDLFLASERRKYQSEEGTFCVHDKKYY
ncbi:MAG: DUF3795 domain-containing protein [Patescibacteria group bacterium]